MKKRLQSRSFISRRDCAGLLLGIGLILTWPMQAADHGDAPLISNDQGADIADVYAFLDPNVPLATAELVAIMTVRGFITPGESENLGFFRDQQTYRFAIETTGDASAEFDAQVTFSPRTDFLVPQTAHVEIRESSRLIASFDAPTTPASATQPTAPPFIVTTDPVSGARFFAGMADDPFFFDVPAELLFRDSLLNGNPDPSVFDRGRDTFAGFNTMAVAISIPLAFLDANAPTPDAEATGDKALGVSASAKRRQINFLSPAGGVFGFGNFVNVDRMGIPAINTLLLPYERRDAYNAASPQQDVVGAFVQDIVSSLRALGTSNENIGYLARLAVIRGDMLRIDTNLANQGPQGGTNPAGFPNGRRLVDDPIDIIVNIIANQLFSTVPPGQPLPPGDAVDNVNMNDRFFEDVFPFLAPPHQPVF